MCINVFMAEPDDEVTVAVIGGQHNESYRYDDMQRFGVSQQGIRLLTPGPALPYKVVGACTVSVRRTGCPAGKTRGT